MEIIPYIKTETGYSIPDEYMMGLYAHMVETGVAYQVFHDDAKVSPHDFLTVCKRPTNTVHIVVDNDKPVFLAWLNDYGANYAYGHFTSFPHVFGTGIARQAAEKTISYWFDWSKPNGLPLIDVLMGRIPSINTRAQKFIESLAFSRLGFVPLMAANITDRDGCMLYYKTNPRSVQNG